MVTAFLQRLRRCWYLLWHPKHFDQFDAWSGRIDVLDPLLNSEAYYYASKAVCKVDRDPSFHPTKDHTIKLSEAMQWANVYANEQGKTTISAWELAFLIQWAVGVLRGKLPC